MPIRADKQAFVRPPKSFVFVYVVLPDFPHRSLPFCSSPYTVHRPVMSSVTMLAVVVAVLTASCSLAAADSGENLRFHSVAIYLAMQLAYAAHVVSCAVVDLPVYIAGADKQLWGCMHHRQSMQWLGSFPEPSVVGERTDNQLCHITAHTHKESTYISAPVRNTSYSRPPQKCKGAAQTQNHWSTQETQMT